MFGSRAVFVPYKLFPFVLSRIVQIISCGYIKPMNRMVFGNKQYTSDVFFAHEWPIYQAYMNLKHVLSLLRPDSERDKKTKKQTKKEHLFLHSVLFIRILSFYVLQYQ